MDHRPVCTLFELRRLSLRTKQYSRSKTGFLSRKRALFITDVISQNHAGQGFRNRVKVSGENLFSGRLSRRHGGRPRPLKVVSAEPAGDIDGLADEIKTRD